MPTIKAYYEVGIGVPTVKILTGDWTTIIQESLSLTGAVGTFNLKFPENHTPGSYVLVIDVDGVDTAWAYFSTGSISSIPVGVGFGIVGLIAGIIAGFAAFRRR